MSVTAPRAGENTAGGGTPGRAAGAAPASILAVDDSTDALALLARILTGAGYQVRLADGGELALAAAVAAPPDLILLDLKMPGIDGLEVCRRLKARKETCDVPVILLSAHAGVEEWVQGLQLGAVDHIGKPIQADELLTRVHTQVALARARASAAEVDALRQLNEQLAAEVGRRQAVEEQLRRALEEKEVLLKEVHHRVKNNLQVVSGLLDLQGARLADPQLRQTLMECKGRIRSIALVHEKLYQNTGLARLNFRHYVQSLVAHLFHAHLGQGSAVRFELNMPDLALDLSAAVPCGLVINELVTNALKYAPRGADPESAPQVTLTWEETATSSRITVSDTGPGLPAGLDITKVETLGLRLVHLLAGQLRGSVRAESGAGCRIIFEFPKI